MALHHIAQRAGLIVELSPPLNSKLLGHGDLDVPYAHPPPQRLEQRIAESKRNQVLDSFLAQIVVNTIDLVLREHAPNTLVDELGGGTIVAKWLLQHDA